MNAMRQDAQKQSRKFCRSKEGKNSETHPEKPEKGETGCVLGAGEDENGWKRIKPGEKTGVRTKMHQMTMQHVQKENRRKPSVFAGFVAGAEGLGLGCRLGRFAAERHWRSLTPRHALRRAQPCLAAKSYRTLTKKSGIAEAIPDFLCFLSKNDAPAQKRDGKSRLYAVLGESQIVNHVTFQKRCGKHWRFRC